MTIVDAGSFARGRAGFDVEAEGGALVDEVVFFLPNRLKFIVVVFGEWCCCVVFESRLSIRRPPGTFAVAARAVWNLLK